MASSASGLKATKILLAISLACLFFGALILRQNGAIFVSPDETAVHFFASTYATTGHLSAPAIAAAIHPRSMLVLGSHLVPAAFLGLPIIAGTFASLVGSWSIPFVPIVLSILAMIAWTSMWRKLLGDRAGLIVGAFSALLPAWWYYTARSLMPNVTFVACLVFAAWVLVCRPHIKPIGPIRLIGPISDAVAGMLFGLALFVRTSEALWAGFIFLVLLVWQRRELTWKGIVAFVAGAIIALIPMFMLQNSLYGSPLATGYTAAQEVSGEAFASIPLDTGAPLWWQHIETALRPAFPFGIHPRLAWTQFVDYGLGMFWWVFVLAAFGIVFLFRPNYQLSPSVSKLLKGYALICFFVSTWLILMYGSWTFTDNPDPTQITIGNSHVRYWLPIFVLMMPFVGNAIDGLMKRVGKFAVAALIVMWIIWAGLGFQSVFLTPGDGLVAEAAVLTQSRTIHNAVIKLTEPNAIIVVDRGDKLFFPDRQVMYPLVDEKTYALLPTIAAKIPLYYYGITLPPKDLAYLNDVKMKAAELTFKPVQTFGIETLYKISK